VFVTYHRQKFELKVKCMEVHTVLCFTLRLPKLCSGQILLLYISTSVGGTCGFKLLSWGLINELVVVLQLIFNIYFKEVYNFYDCKNELKKPHLHSSDVEYLKVKCICLPVRLWNSIRC
jgi:hypothetical protein